jgi:hypothetical protein
MLKKPASLAEAPPPLPWRWSTSLQSQERSEWEGALALFLVVLRFFPNTILES